MLRLGYHEVFDKQKVEGELRDDGYLLPTVFNRSVEGSRAPVVVMVEGSDV